MAESSASCRITDFACRRVLQGPPTITSMRFSRALKDAPTTTSPRIYRRARTIWSVALSRIT